MLSNTIQKIISYIKQDIIKYFVLKILFRRNKLRLKAFYIISDRFYIYKVENKYLPAESINWFVNYPYFKQACDQISLFYYKIKPGDVIVDIGAGIGEETIVYSEYTGEYGKVYAIEANPSVCQVLNRVVDLNNLHNVNVLNVAINTANEKIALEEDNEHYLSGTINSQSNKNTSKSYTVEGMRFDTFISGNKIEKIDFLKCNIEGAERFLVDSISPENLKKIKQVAISCHDFRYGENHNEFFKTKNHVTQFLTSQGFIIRTQNTQVSYIDDWVYGTNPAFLN